MPFWVDSPHRLHAHCALLHFHRDLVTRSTEHVIARPEFAVGARVEYISTRSQQLMRGVITTRSPWNMLEAAELQSL